MNTHAQKTNAALYATAAAGKRNSCADKPQRLCQNFKQELYAGRKKVLPGSHGSRGSVSSVITFFNGTVVRGYVPAVEWGAADFL